MNMNGMPDDSKPLSDDDKAMAWNRSWILIGLLPFVPSFILALILGKPIVFLAPLYGVCPLDFLHHQSSPPPGQVLLWGFVSAFICLAFAIYAYFFRPYGIIFAITIWASTAMLLLRLYEVLKGVQ
jgi:hypothetical protein